MATQVQSHDDALHATDTALRLVNRALGDLGTAGPGAPFVPRLAVPGSGVDALNVASTLLRAYDEVTSLIERIRLSRGLLQEAQATRLEQMNKKLSAVTAATEMAATGMLDGLDRAISVVSSLEQEAEAAQDADRSARYAGLREELYNVMAFVQFQDITSQQLGYAAAVISETEQRLEQLGRIFAPFAPEAAAMPEATSPVAFAPPVHCDSNAVSDKTDSQAFADAIFRR